MGLLLFSTVGSSSTTREGRVVGHEW